MLHERRTHVASSFAPRASGRTGGPASMPAGALVGGGRDILGDNLPSLRPVRIQSRLGLKDLDEIVQYFPRNGFVFLP
ncbi:Uncharacterised protein [uncultured archaeon]|nr:Uncharacterised protein [uncultured archaeon]